MKLKICGMKQPENILEVGTLLPDYMGFIFYEKSTRYFDGALPQLPESIKKVGVFVNESIENIIQKINQYKLQAIQLHGQETAEFIQELKTKINSSIEIIKVFSVGTQFNFQQLEPYEQICDFFLFDTQGKLPGGNGTTFNWDLLEKYPSTKPFFLSGGIGVEEIENLKKINVPLYALDVNSKFEIEPGLKNKELLYRFMKNLKLAKPKN